MKTLELAKDIAFLCRKNNYQFNNTKIQKLLYLFVGFCLINDVSEIYDIDETPKLWPYGPVFPRVHKKYQDQISPSKLKHHSIFISISENGTNLIVNNGKSHFQEKITGSELNSK